MSTCILAINTSTEACSVALWNQGEVFVLSELRPRAHTNHILPMIKKVLANAGLGLSQLDVLAFGRGPGSFTGIRIGMSVAQGLALGSDLPMLGISDLQTMAQGVWRTSNATYVLTAINARMGEVYFGQFERQQDGHWHASEKEALISPVQALRRACRLHGHWVCVGTGWELCPSLARETKLSVYNDTILLPQVQDMLPLALVAWQQGLAVAVENATLTYLYNNIIYKKYPNG